MSTSESTSTVLESLIALRRALKLELPEVDGESRVTGAQAQVLLQLAQSGPVSMGSLARALGVTFPAATTLVARLEAAGKVERVFSRDDRRKVLVDLTPGARSLAEGVLEERRRWVTGVLDALPPVEREGFVRGIQMLARGSLAGAGWWLSEVHLWAEEFASLGAAL